MSHRLGIDIGGTFTDFVLIRPDGELRTTKVLSNPGDLHAVIGQGLSELAGVHGVGTAQLLADIDLIVHGTTIATNALIQRRLAKVGMIGTAGFRDALSLREGYKEDVFDYFLPPPEPLVPRYLSQTVRERIDRDGQIIESLHEPDVLAAIDLFKAEQVEAVAVGLLWSVVNPAHENRVGEMVREHLPNVPVFLSSHVSPQIREYPRYSTTALCAALAGRLESYIETLEDRLRGLGFNGAIRYIQCNGGTTSGDLLKACPVRALDSGPAAGPAAALFFARQAQAADVVTLDMGGTSLDVSLVKNGQIETAANVDVHRYRVSVPMVGVRTIGAGGGSIAWLDQSGVLQVGPQSAESDPGPACYMRGGQLPTVTDANVVLGYFGDEQAWGGAMRIDSSLARNAIEQHMARPLNISVEEAAHAIYTVVNENMANAVRQISTERGYDIRDFVFVCGGGCSAAHAARIAQSVGVTRVIVPRIASLLCSFGAAITDVRHDYTQMLTSRFSDCDIRTLTDQFDTLSARAYADLALEGFDADHVRLQRTMDVRYSGELGELTIDITQVNLDCDGIAGAAEMFHDLHERTYTFADRDSECELMAIGVVAYGLRESRIENVFDGALVQPDSIRSPAPLTGNGYLGTRKTWFDRDGRVDTPIYAGNELASGVPLDGPVIIEVDTMTLVVPPLWQVSATDGYAWLMQWMGD